MTAPQPSDFSLHPSAFPLVVMGVSGSGKSTVGRAAALRLGRPFLEGDAFHPPANVAKMARGHPLTDADRAPWLAALHDQLVDQPRAVLACSALRQAYRDTLARGLASEPRWVFLDAPRAALLARMRRRDHFMPPSLLTSQLATLQPPGGPGALRLDAMRPVEDLVDQIAHTLPP